MGLFDKLFGRKKASVTPQKAPVKSIEFSSFVNHAIHLLSVKYNIPECELLNMFNKYSEETANSFDGMDTVLNKVLEGTFSKDDIRYKKLLKEEKEYIDEKIETMIYSFICLYKSISNLQTYHDINKFLPNYYKEYPIYINISKYFNFNKLLNKAITNYKRNHKYEENKYLRIVTDDDFLYLSYPENITLDVYNLSLNSINYFQDYWENVLNGYKTQKGYLNRLKYLIETTEEMKALNFINGFPDILERLIVLQESYKALVVKNRFSK